MYNTNCKTKFQSFQQNYRRDLELAHYKELKESAILDSIINLNYFSADGYLAEQLYMRNWEGHRNNAGVSAAISRKTDHISKGCWYCKVANGNAILKPDFPRDSLKGKPIKYESGIQCQSSLIILKYSYEAIELVAKRYGIKEYPKGNFKKECVEAWEWINSQTNIPISITEGAKKRGCMVSKGYAVVGTAGVYVYNDNSEEEKLKKASRRKLIPEFYQFSGKNFRDLAKRVNRITTISTKQASHLDRISETWEVWV